MLYYKGGSADITPAAHLKLAGFAGRVSPSSDVAEPLEANVVFLQDNGTDVIFISLDLLYVGKSLKRRILDELGDILDDTTLFISASHSHFAPGTDEHKTSMGEIDPGYVAYVGESIVNKIREIDAAEYEAVTLRYHEGWSDCCINRRRLGWSFSTRSLLKKTMLTLPNPGGIRDNKMRVLTVHDARNACKAVLWNFCCHPSGTPCLTSVSADFPGLVRSRVRGHLGSGELPVVFWQGFSGDIVPPAFSKWPGNIFSGEFVNFMIRRAINGPEFSNFAPAEWEKWSDELYDDFQRAFSKTPEVVVDRHIAVRRKTIPLSAIGFRSPDMAISLHSVLLGKRLRIVGISAEPVVEYITILEELFPDDIIIPVGCLDNAFGYLPTEEMLPQDGYEVSGFTKYCNLEGNITPGFQETIVRGLKDLAR